MDDDATYAVHLRAPVGVVREATEAHWRERPLVLERSRTGTAAVMGETTDLEAAARWALGFGADATVCGPPALRDEIQRQARAIARRYEKETPEAERPQAHSDT